MDSGCPVILSCYISSATSHSDVQYVESLWTIRHYVMRPTICSKRFTHILNFSSVFIKTVLTNVFQVTIHMGETVQSISNILELVLFSGPFQWTRALWRVFRVFSLLLHCRISDTFSESIHARVLQLLHAEKVDGKNNVIGQGKAEVIMYQIKIGTREAIDIRKRRSTQQ